MIISGPGMREHHVGVLIVISIHHQLELNWITMEGIVSLKYRYIVYWFCSIHFPKGIKFRQQITWVTQTLLREEKTIPVLFFHGSGLQTAASVYGTILHPRILKTSGWILVLRLG